MIKCALHDGGKIEVLKNNLKKMKEYLHLIVTLLRVCHRQKLKALQILYPLHMSPGSVYLVTCSERIQNHSSELNKVQIRCHVRDRIQGRSDLLTLREREPVTSFGYYRGGVNVFPQCIAIVFLTRWRSFPSHVALLRCFCVTFLPGQNPNQR